MSDSYDDYESKIQLAEHEWEMVKTEHDRAVELGKAYERGWNAALAQQEPVAEIQTEDMGKPFNAIRVTAHFYAEVPAVGTKLYKAPPKRDLTCVCGAVWEGETMVHPPRKREWVGLHGSEVPDTYKYDVMFMEGWLWAEERLKEKNT